VIIDGVDWSRWGLRTAALRELLVQLGDLPCVVDTASDPKADDRLCPICNARVLSELQELLVIYERERVGGVLGGVSPLDN